MTQESLSLAVAVKPATVIVQVVETNWSLDDLEQAMQGMRTVLESLTLSTQEIRRLDYRSLQVVLPDPDEVAILIEALSDRLDDDPVTVRLTVTLGNVRLQIQTDAADEILGMLPALDRLLPARQLFQARANYYARRGGELSPAERANLELLAYRLGLPDQASEAMINRALGPYLNRQAKLNRYREVLSAELERRTPLSNDTWAELRRLYQGLGLTYEDVAPIDQEYIARIQAEVTRLQQQEQETRLQQETLLQYEEQQQEIAEQQDYAEAYRQEFRAAIAHTLYPSEFERGRLEQARRLWDLDPEVVRAIEREVTDECYGPIESDYGLDYSRLRQLLWLNQWEAADQETERLILTALTHDMRPVDAGVILQFSCLDIQTLDTLWARYSQGKFGFRAQYRVYLQQNRHADEFLVALAWQDALGVGGVNLMTRRKSYHELQFNLDAPVGHLPTWRWAAASLEGGYFVNDSIVDGFFLHLEKCTNLNLEALPPPSADEGYPEP